MFNKKKSPVLKFIVYLAIFAILATVITPILILVFGSAAHDVWGPTSVEETTYEAE